MTSTIHATSIKLGDTGCLIRGPSGSGKSLLALELLDRAGENAALIADDQTTLTVKDNKLIATCPPALKGKIELYGRGIIEWPTIEHHQIDLVIDLVDEIERMPPRTAFTCIVNNITLRRIPVPNHALTDLAHQHILVQAGLFYK
ncbi:MAG: HPr kinase/phosphatase C-terminal domain-containing protein [Rhizobiaceae bacterium]|nr:HPr kinase/phosphatase C-terminal domain-containing protein [Rhizobiaceae bacterium]